MSTDKMTRVEFFSDDDDRFATYNKKLLIDVVRKQYAVIQ